MNTNGTLVSAGEPKTDIEMIRWMLNRDCKLALLAELNKLAALEGTGSKSVLIWGMRGDEQMKYVTLLGSKGYTAILNCHHEDREEVAMSGCEHGCKYYRCNDCGVERVVHHPVYGCKKLTAF